LNKREIKELIQLSEDILYFPGHANIVVLNLGKNSLMIDCGRNIAEASNIRKEAESFFENKIQYVVLTHLHSDHTASIPLFSDCQIIASNQLNKYLRAAKRKPRKNYPLIYPNVVFDNEYILKVSDFEIIIRQTGGHTPDSSYIYSPVHKLLAVGDNLRSDFLWGGRQSDPEKWIDALKQYLTFEVDFIILGHGEIFVKEEVKEILKYVIEVKKLLLGLMEENTSDYEKIIQKVNTIEPRGEHKVYIHDDTIKKWYKFWKKKNNKNRK
jgi:glyoxylase-like metal-dependent hydrolase (beta-lactamase superfamily II)